MSNANSTAHLRIPGKLILCGPVCYNFPSLVIPSIFGSLEPSLQTKWRLGDVRVERAFPFASPTEMGRSQI